MNTAEQCRAMGLKVGDTIEGREESGPAYWNEARLTLLWLGEQIAVFSETSRSNVRPQWSYPEECANWTLDCREWRRAAFAAQPAAPRSLFASAADHLVTTAPRPAPPAPPMPPFVLSQAQQADMDEISDIAGVSHATAA